MLCLGGSTYSYHWFLRDKAIKSPVAEYDGHYMYHGSLNRGRHFLLLQVSTVTGLTQDMAALGDFLFFSYSMQFPGAAACKESRDLSGQLSVRISSSKHRLESSMV
jgi:hypothetical protein